MVAVLSRRLACKCGRILGGRNLVRVHIIVAAIFDFMTMEDWGEYVNSKNICAPKENARTAG